MERARKIEELQKRLIESESLRTKYNRKVTLLKDQIRSTGETIDQERHMSEHSLHLLREELGRLKEDLSEVNRRESQLQSFKGSIAKILGDFSRILHRFKSYIPSNLIILITQLYR